MTEGLMEGIASMDVKRAAFGAATGLGKAATDRFLDGVYEKVSHALLDHFSALYLDYQEIVSRDTSPEVQQEQWRALLRSKSDAAMRDVLVSIPDAVTPGFGIDLPMIDSVVPDEVLGEMVRDIFFGVQESLAETSLFPDRFGEPDLAVR